MTNNNKFTEPEHRFCPICDKKIKKGSPFHKCSKKQLKEIETEHLDFSEECTETEEERTFDDKLQEFEEQYDNDNYYDIDEEEQ